MKAQELLLICSEPGFWGQERKPWVSIDLRLFLAELQKQGLNPKLTDIQSVALEAAQIRDRCIFYAFSQRAHLRRYIKDVLTFLARHNTLIPSLELLLSHENKGYAQLYAQRLGLSKPQGWYLTDIEQLKQLKLSYPIVLKSISGTNAKAVWLCNSEAEIRSRLKHLAKGPGSLAKLDYLRRKHLRGGRTYPGYPRFEPRQDAQDWLTYMTPGANFLLQEYIPDLDCDYRVIAAGKRFYLMQRLVNKGDFRASGTKKFVFDIQPPEGLLDFALDVYRRFDAPYLSMDIGHREGQSYLFEFQALHFGTAAIVRSQGYWVHEGGAWQFHREDSVLEPVLALGLAEYLEGKQW